MNTPLDKMLLPGMQAMLTERLKPLFEQQETEFKEREVAFRKHLQCIASEIVISTASAVSYDEQARTITFQLKFPA